LFFPFTFFKRHTFAILFLLLFVLVFVVADDGVVRSLVWLHSWEQEHFLDVIRICQQHCQTINAHAPSSGRWQAVFECLHKCLIDALCLVIAGFLGRSLFLEALELDLRVVQLGVRVDHLMLVREQLKTLCKAFLRAMPLGQRAHQLRVIYDEAGADAL